jgi:hypothetical protein
LREVQSCVPSVLAVRRHFRWSAGVRRGCPVRSRCVACWAECLSRLQFGDSLVATLLATSMCGGLLLAGLRIERDLVSTSTGPDDPNDGPLLASFDRLLVGD